jgi:hypothetical protein
MYVDSHNYAILAGKEASGGAESITDFLLSAVPAGRNAMFKQSRFVRIENLSGA